MENIRVHYLQHVSFEALGSMDEFFQKSEYVVSSTKLYAGEELPEISSFDLLIVMGGPMGVYDTEEYPWLSSEIEFIKSCIEDDKYVLGICLGAQLIAHVLGASIVKNRFKEIGWFPLEISTDLGETFLEGAIDPCEEVFHWHGDTFSIPHGAVKIASSEACENQAFIYNERVLALQFHLETTVKSAKSLLENCGDDIDGSDFTQSPCEILESEEKFEKINSSMESVLIKFICLISGVRV